jgi:uroporphyrinogen III methyltransferase/synthase
MKTGKVWLVGAGPGDYGLLTLKGKAVLEAADVVVHDRLAGEDILLRLPPKIRIIDAGKISGSYPNPQEEIRRILIAEARQGRNVVRLKGGDPFLFGRGGEEALTLEDAGIPWEVVPGLSSALTVPALAGIPLTYRGLSSSLHIITWRGKDSAAPAASFLQTLAKARGTLVILMGGSALPEIGTALIKAGFAPALPAAIVENGAGPRQAIRCFILEELAALPPSAGNFANGKIAPTLVVVGEVCFLGEKLRTSLRTAVAGSSRILPLRGLRIVVTRPEPRNTELCGTIRSLGGTAIPFPCIKTVSREDAVAKELLKAGDYSWLLFTSATGVEFFFRRFIGAGGDLRSLGTCRIGAVGPATAAALKCRGLIPDLVPPFFNSRSLGETLAEKISTGESVLILRPRKTGPDLTKELRRKNIPFRELILYETLPTEGSEFVRRIILEERFDFVHFASPSAVWAFAAAFPSGVSEGIVALCIGETTAASARELGMDVRVTAETGAEGLRRLAGEIRNEL